MRELNHAADSRYILPVLNYKYFLYSLSFVSPDDSVIVNVAELKSSVEIFLLSGMFTPVSAILNTVSALST